MGVWFKLVHDFQFTLLVTVLLGQEVVDVHVQVNLAKRVDYLNGCEKHFLKS